MRRQLPNDQRPFRIFRDTEQELAHEQARLRVNHQDPKTEDNQEDNQEDNKSLPVIDATHNIPDQPAPNVLGPTAGSAPESGSPDSVPTDGRFFSADWPFTKDVPGTEQIKVETPAGMAFYGELATAYVPWQTFSQTLDLREALRVGTLFPELIRTPPLYQRPGS